MKKLEKIFWYRGNFVDEMGKEVNPLPIHEPYSMKLYLDEKDAHKQIEDFVNTDCSFQGVDVNAYSVGTRSNNERGAPIQFYNIE
jgi:hypothetical protein